MVRQTLRSRCRRIPAFASLALVVAGGLVSEAKAQHENVTYRWVAPTMSEGVNDFAISPNGRVFISGDRGSYIRMHLGSPVNPISFQYYFQHNAIVRSVAISPDSMYFAVGDEGNRVNLFELWTGRKLWSTPTRGDARVVRFSDDGTRILWANDFGQVGAINLVGREVWRRRPSTGSFTHSALSPDGVNFAITGADRHIYVFDATTGATRRTILRGGQDAMRGLQFNASNQLYGADFNGTLYRWNSDGTPTVPQPAAQTGDIDSMELAPVGTNMLLGMQSNRIRIVNRDTGALVRESLPLEGRPEHVHYFSDGARFAAAGDVGGVGIFDSTSLNMVDFFGTVETGLAALAWEPNAGRIHLGDSFNQGSITSGSQYNILAWQDEGSQVNAVAVSPSTGQVARGLGNGNIRIRNTSDGALVATREHTGGVTDLEFSSGGSAMISSSWDGMVHAWTGTNYAVRRNLLDLGTVNPLCVAFRPNGAHIAVGSDDNRFRLIRFGDAVSVLTSSIFSHPVRRVRFSPNSRYVAAIYGPNLDIYEILDTPSFSINKLYTISNPNGRTVSDMAFTPDSNRFLITEAMGNDSRMFMHTSSTGALVQTLDGFPDSPLEIAYSPRQDAIAMIHGGGWVSVIGDPAIDWLTSVEPSTFGVIGGNPFMVQLTLSAPAPATGAVIGVSVPAGSPVQVPSAVFVQPFAREVILFASTTAVSIPTDVVVSGAYRLRATTRTITVLPPTVESIVSASVSFRGGTTVPVTVRLSGPAPTGGTVVTLTRSAAILGAPATVTVPAGARHVTFNMTTSAPVTAQRVWIQARTGPALRYQWMNVNP